MDRALDQPVIRPDDQGNDLVIHLGNRLLQEPCVDPQPVAGLMSTGSCREVGVAYASLDSLVKQLGSTLRSPFMTLSFMALLVIPEIKLSDKGLFDANRFEFMPLFVPD